MNRTRYGRVNYRHSRGVYGRTRNQPSVQPFTTSSLPVQEGNTSDADMDGSRSGSPSASTSSSRSTTPLDAPSMEAIVELCKETSTLVRVMNGKLLNIEERTQKLSSTLKELNEYVKKYCKNSFSVKGSQYERCIRTEVTKLFCLSLKRKPEDSDIKEAIVKAIGSDVRDRPNVYSYVKNKLTDYRTEERRKILGIVPYERSCFLDTRTLCNQIVNCMLPSGGEMDTEDRSIYLRNLAFLRKFVRDSEGVPATNFYASFREWLDINFSTVNEDVYHQVLDEDENIDYSTLGSGVTMMEEVVVQTSESQ